MEAGWYTDPLERFAHRWWDGDTWTGYVADESVGWDDLPEEKQEPAIPVLPGLPAAIIGYVVGVTLGLTATALLENADEPGGRAVTLLASSAGLYAGLVGACLYVTFRRGSRSFTRDFGWRGRWIDIGFGCAGSIAGRLASFVAVMLVAPFIYRSQAPDRQVFEDVAIGAWGWVALVFIVCIAAPVVEELFFRGLLQTRLVGLMGPTLGVVIASILFGAAHLTAWDGPLTLVYALAVAGGGLVLGTIYHMVGRLGPSIAAHAFFNAQAMLAVALFS